MKAEIGNLVLGLQNIGIDRAENLNAIGFVYAGDLIASSLSIEDIWKMLYCLYPTVDLQDIYAIEVARFGLRIKELPKERKGQFRAFVESVKELPMGQYL